MYQAPVKDAQFILESAGYVAWQEAHHHPVDMDTVTAVFAEAARLAQESWAPTNQPLDRDGVTLGDDGVMVPDYIIDSYKAFAEGGWGALAAPEAYGGAAMPRAVSFAVDEFWHSANMALALCPMLTLAAIEALVAHANDDLKNTYLPKLVSGEWTGTMNLTEPQAGSDLSAIRAMATPDGDHYRLQGQKIYITWGEHNATENIVHMVLARTPDAPAGVKGISLFLVPRFVLNEKNEAVANDVHCSGIEHKLGIHGSPTCVMNFGDTKGAVAYLVGELNQGLRHMFTMMNQARLAVGLQGVSISERSFQLARAYADERVQGKTMGGKTPVAIAHHPDVRRMLLTMSATTQAMRALCLHVSFLMDQVDTGDDSLRSQVDLLVPVAKAFCTELAQELTGLGVQIHGGMGYVEETGAAQHVRDARILTIYEGTTGIQAQDFMLRKILRDNGEAFATLVTFMRDAIAKQNHSACTEFEQMFNDLLTTLENTVSKCIADDDANASLSASTHLLMATGYLFSGALLFNQMNAPHLDSMSERFVNNKTANVRFYLAQVLPRAAASISAAMAPVDVTMGPAVEQI